jgi:hypothetical protein
MILDLGGVVLKSYAYEDFGEELRSRCETEKMTSSLKDPLRRKRVWSGVALLWKECVFSLAQRSIRLVWIGLDRTIFINGLFSLVHSSIMSYVT